MVDRQAKKSPMMTPREEPKTQVLDLGEVMEIEKVVMPDTFSIHPPLVGEIGELAAVRPNDPKFEGKTFLGIVIGDVPIGLNVSTNEEMKMMRLRPLTSLLLFLPDVSAFVYGSAAFWHVIEKASDLEPISDEELERVEYVKAIRQIEEKKGEGS